MMIHYFWGEDTWAARAAISVLADELKARVEFLDKAALEEQSLALRLENSGGLFGKTLLVVRDPSLLPAHLQKALVDLASEKISGEVVLWDREKPDQRSAFVKAFKKHGRQFGYVSDSEMATWLMAQAKELGGNLEPAAARLLVSRLGFDRWQLLQELQKLLLLSPEVTVAQVETYVAVGVTQEDAFQLVEAIMHKQEAIALTKVENLLLTGEAELRLLGLIAYQLRTLLVIQGGLREKLGSEDIAKKFKLHPYVVKKNLRLAQGYSNAQLLDMYTRLLATDFAMKQGKVDMRTGLIMLLRGLMAPVTKNPA